MKEQLVEKETALVAKEKGFDWETLYFWCNDKLETTNIFLFNHQIRSHSYQKFVNAPTHSLLQKWLREEHEIFVEVNFFDSATNDWFSQVYARDIMSPVFLVLTSKEYDTYEQALEVGLLEALKLINNG